MQHSIKTKIIFSYSLVTIMFTTLLMVALYTKEKDNVLELALKSSSELASMHANLLSREFSQYISMLKVVSGDIQIKQGDTEHIKSALNRLMSVGDDSFLNAVYVDNALNLIDSKGFTGKISHSAFLTAEQWRGKEFNITSPLKSQFEGELVTMVAVPILDDDNNWQGTLATAVSLSKLSDRLSSIKLARDSYAWLSDANGNIISHPNDDFIMSFNLSEAESFGFPGFDKVLNKVKVQEFGYGEYQDINIDEEKVVTFAKVENVPGWTLYITTLKSDIIKDVNEILISLLITSIFLMTICLWFIYQLSQRMTKPIVQLTREVSHSINMPGSPITVIRSGDEIEKLSIAFSQTLIKTNMYAQYLEEMVRSRTKEVEAKNNQLETQNVKLEELASKDALTNLYNRRAFQIFVTKEIARVKRYRSEASLAVVDIDHFKQINDTHGHAVGDDILRKLAGILITQSRIENVSCRWGGEEFVILIPEADSQKAFCYIDTLRTTISQSDFSPVESLTISSGISSCQLTDTFENWFQRADAALYTAKNSGRNKVIVDKCHL
ncbi:sensor domain-containing diguanylate cyclase [Vibrio algarum]|uniref:diguanylate cyclase n=1 Tax=Vibrio algarum TaxID=3020714 RepID=A0ABT4YWA6_9VIBR|nr:sensor domain-containing diguanylate cyclase [Vibrio sp. KJ40-1]MDB1125872.1 diguanylate cyclase [Vibrio sp. KJ40-1]